MRDTSGATPERRGQGRALPPTLRAPLVDLPLLGHVRLHDDAEGDALARREGALAVTSGLDIYFAAGAFRPQTREGCELIRHELGHVIQQHSTGGPPAGYRSHPGDRFEHEADRFARDGTMPAHDGLAAPAASVRQRRTAAEQIATVLRNAMVGLGTDEEAVFNALTGRSMAELEAIKAAYVALSGGETLEHAIRDDFSGAELSRALSLLHGETAVTETARTLWDAMRGLGTDEEAIYAAVAGRSAEEWRLIQDAFRTMTGDDLVAELRSELTDDEWRYVETLLPGAAGGAVTAEDRATVIANRIQQAVAGPGTDEEAIYAALTGRSDAELREIERRFKLLTGEDLDVRLRDELTDAEYARVQELLFHPSAATRIAMRLRDAVQGPGTNESAIIAILTGRTAAELVAIRAEYLRLYRESLRARLEEELSGTEALEALELERNGLLAPEDEIKIAIAGPGTDEERLFAVLRELTGNRARIMATIDAYAAKGYGDMLDDIRDDLSGDDLANAIELLHGLTPSGTCSTEERKTALEAISGAVSLAQNAVAELGADVARGSLSSDVERALERNFNPGGAAGAVTVGLAGSVRTVLNDARTDLLTVSDVTCGAPAPCVAKPSCSEYIYGWTVPSAGSTVRLCPAFFSCLDDRPLGTLHEFVHHTGVSDHFYHYKAGYATLTPGGTPDSLDNADSFAYLAKELS